jgi:glycerophosphoryl diester phosphodiesterase
MKYAHSSFLTAVLFAGWLMMNPAFATEIVAHRGASFDAPENTLASINLAWRQKADAVEIDIYLTADGKIVAIHDKTTKRTGGGKDKPVVEQTLAELKQLDFGAWKSPKYAGERIPTLEEIVKTIPEGKRVFIEIKTEAEILPELKRVLAEVGRPPAQTPLISFSYETMRVAKEQLPELKVYWVVKLSNDKETGRPNYTAAELIAKVKAAKLDGVNLGSSPPLTAEFVREFKAAGLELYIWTVNDADKADEYRQLGVDGVETDRPDLLRSRFKDKAGS